MTRYLVNSARPLIFSTGLPPAAAAAAMAALELLQEQPRRVERLADNAGALRDELAREGFDVSGSETQIVPLIVGEADLAMRICEAALEQGVFAQAIRPPTVPEGTSRLRLAVMASHTRSELRDAARVLAQAALRNGLRPRRPSRSRRRSRPRRPPRRRCGCSTATPRSAAEGGVSRRAACPLMRGLFVTGTDTGVGKTVVAGAIVAALRARGERVAAFKPVVTGLDEPAEPGWPRDHELLAAAAGVAAGGGRAARVRPAGLAASGRRARGRRARPRGARRRRERRRRRSRRERARRRGRGRAARPADGRDTACATSRVALGFPLVVAARPGLGTISHTLLTLEAARAAGLTVAAS